MAIAARRQRSWAEYGLAHYESETPEERFERERLKKRIAEEAGPVKTYQAIEEWLPEQGRKGDMTVGLRKSGLFIGRAVMKEALKAAGEDCRRCRLRWNHLDKSLTIELTPDGPWIVNFKHARKPGESNVSPGKTGGNTIPARIRAQGIENGSYPARVEGNRIIVEFGKGRVAK